jgi:DME family drug/metabolite transporter
VLVLAVTGLVLVSSTAGLGETGPRPVLGVVLAVLSGTMYALTTMLAEAIAATTTPLALTSVATGAGAVALLPLGLLGGRGDAPLVTTDPVALATLAYLGLFTMALAYGLLYAGLRTTSGSAAVVASLLEPVTAALVAAVFLDERLGVAGVVGTLLILAAVAGLGRRETPPVPPPA